MWHRGRVCFGWKGDRPGVRLKNRTVRAGRSPKSTSAAKDSVIFSGGDSSKNYGADQQRLQISDLHFDKFPTPATFACWKIRFETEVCTCSQFLTEAMQWIKKVEMVDSVDDFKSLSSTRGIPMSNFEVLDVRIASALNKIIHNSHFKRRISLEEQKAQKQDRLLRGRQIAYLIYQYFRVTGANDSVENYADLFTISLRNDDIQEFDSKVGRNFIIDETNPIWWHLGRIVEIKSTRVWETQDRIGIVQFGYSSEEIRAWSSQIENNGEEKYRPRNSKSEFWDQKWKLWEKRRGQESGNKTACTKKSRRLLAMGSLRAVFERRQLQFPSRYQ